MIRMVGLTIITTVVLLTLILSNQATLSTTKSVATSHDQRLVKINQAKENIEVHDPHTLSKEEIEFLTHQFIDLLVQTTDDDDKVIHFQTKNELVEQFRPISSDELALSFINNYYIEDEDKLYIIPTELPPWIYMDEKYDVIQTANNQVKVRQENELELYGTYIIEVVFTFCDNWKITDIHYLYREQSDQEKDLSIL